MATAITNHRNALMHRPSLINRIFCLPIWLATEGRIGIFVCFCYLLQACANQSVEENSPLKVSDPKLPVELITEQPDIVTPIGLAIDQDDALYVLESHTHSPPKDYPGPSFDHIKRGTDTNGDGRPDSWTVFADSIVNGANMAFDPEGELYVTAKNVVWAFKDTDGDGISDEKRQLVSMPLPEYVYDHAGILGIAIGEDGWVYLSRGNLGSKYWRIAGTDDSTIDGYGEGGLIFRCKSDGSSLEKLATGFWNPFDLKFSREGRLFATDNDPDSRGPNRLLEIVPGGDYGFKCLYGGSGLHPYVAWNGELPGTLPMAAPLGEAPCALIDASFTNFGNDYEGNILVNVWEEKNIVRIPLNPSGSSVKGKGDVWLQGDDTFHPVALATDSKGNLYITDWVKREYPNHLEGKIWRISNPDQGLFPQKKPSKINRFTDRNRSFDELSDALLSGDPYEQAIARYRLKGAEYEAQVQELSRNANPLMRLQAVLIWQKNTTIPDKLSLERLLSDEDDEVLKATLMYIGSKQRTDLKSALNQVLASGKIGPDLFDIWLATVEHLQAEFMQNYASKSGISADKIKQKLPEAFIETLISDNTIPEATRALAIPRLKNPLEKQEMLLNEFRKAQNEAFKLALVKALKNSREDHILSDLLRLAKDKQASASLRAQAIIAIPAGKPQYCSDITILISQGNELVQQAATRYVCSCQNVEEIEAAIAKIADPDTRNRALSIWNLCTGKTAGRPATTEVWAQFVDGSGNSQRGRLVFESTYSQCQSCHQIEGWGGIYGPGLSHVGSSKSRTQLVNAILQPSLEIAPEWQGWYVIDEKGNKHLGRQIDVHFNRAELMNLAGGFDNYDNPQDYGIMKESLMPEGLQHALTKDEFNDLIAYLESLK